MSGIVMPFQFCTKWSRFADATANVIAPLLAYEGLTAQRRCGKLRSHLFTSLDHPELPADNNGSERELRPTAIYRKVTGGFCSDWGADLFAGVRSVIGTAARRGVSACQAIQQTLRRQAAIYPG